MKLLLVNNIMGPLRFPIFNAIADLPEIQFQVLFLSRTDANRQWTISTEHIEFDYTVLPGVNFYSQKFDLPLYLSRGVSRTLSVTQPEVICIMGYNHLATLQVLRYAKRAEAKTVLWTGSHLDSSMVKSRILDRYKRWIIPKFDAYVTYGTAATQHITHFNAPPERIVTACNTIDVKWFEEQSSSLGANEVQDMRREYPHTNILYVGSFIERKGVMHLIKAFKSMGRDDASLILVGDGPQIGEYEQYIREHQLPNVNFVGFQQKNEIVKYFHISDIFVLPSHVEVWGLVVNEAMACSLPVVVSDQTGAARDIVEDGINGYTYPSDDTKALASRLNELLNDEKKRIRMGKASLKRISRETPEAYAEGILNAARLALCS